MLGSRGTDHVSGIGTTPQGSDLSPATLLCNNCKQAIGAAATDPNSKTGYAIGHQARQYRQPKVKLPPFVFPPRPAPGAIGESVGAEIEVVASGKGQIAANNRGANDESRTPVAVSGAKKSPLIENRFIIADQVSKAKGLQSTFHPKLPSSTMMQDAGIESGRWRLAEPETDLSDLSEKRPLGASGGSTNQNQEKVRYTGRAGERPRSRDGSVAGGESRRGTFSQSEATVLQGLSYKYTTHDLRGRQDRHRQLHGSGQIAEGPPDTDQWASSPSRAGRSGDGRRSPDPERAEIRATSPSARRKKSKHAPDKHKPAVTALNSHHLSPWAVQPQSKHMTGLESNMNPRASEAQFSQSGANRNRDVASETSSSSQQKQGSKSAGLALHGSRATAEDTAAGRIEISRRAERAGGSSGDMPEPAVNMPLVLASQDLTRRSSRKPDGNRGRDEDTFGIHGLTIVVHMNGNDDLVISTDLTKHAPST